MKKITKMGIISISLIMLTGVVLAGCGGGKVSESPSTSKSSAADSGKAAKKEPKDIKIGVTLVNIVEPFFADIKSGLEEEAKAQGIGRIDIQDGQNDPAKQMAQVEDFIAQGFDLIIINPTEAQSLVSAAEAANKAGIPVFTMDRRLETKYGEGGVVLTHLGASAEDGGILGMQIVADKLKELNGSEKGNVLYLEGQPGSSTAKDRTTGVNKTLEKYPNIKIIAHQPGESREKGLDATENWLQQYKDVDAIYAYSGDGALGALKALENVGNKKIFVVGTGGEANQYKAIKDGTQLIGTIDFSGKGTGRDAVQTAIKVLNGEKVEPWVVSKATMVTKANVDEFLK